MPPRCLQAVTNDLAHWRMRAETVTLATKSEQGYERPDRDQSWRPPIGDLFDRRCRSRGWTFV